MGGFLGFKREQKWWGFFWVFFLGGDWKLEKKKQGWFWGVFFSFG
jgi:hypothetical protein